MSKNNPQTREEKEAKFLVELAKLSNKYGVSIGGCGCCGSPYLGEVKKPGHYVTSGGEELRFIENE